jgi:hypothetical protein
MIDKDAVVGMLKNYLLPGAYPVAKADIETAIKFIESMDSDAALGKALTDTIESTTRKFAPGMCIKLPPEINEHYCGDCIWPDVCRIRAEREENTDGN